METHLHVFFPQNFSDRGQSRIMESVLDLLKEAHTVTLTAFDPDEPPFGLMSSAGDDVLILPPADAFASWVASFDNLAEIHSPEDFYQLVPDCPACKLLGHMRNHRILFKDCETAPPDTECTPGILGGPIWIPPIVVHTPVSDTPD